MAVALYRTRARPVCPRPGLYGGAALKAAMHSCAVTGVCFCAWAAVCAAGAASYAVHVAAILAIGFFVAGPGGVLGSSARGLVGYAGTADVCPLKPAPRPVLRRPLLSLSLS
eukprot:5877659-Prymnesium_polylepis.1